MSNVFYVIFIAMNNIDEQQIVSIENTNTPVPKINVDKIGMAYYGDDFIKFQKVGEFKDLIPMFKEHYYTKKLENQSATIANIMAEFNKQLESVGRVFQPPGSQVTIWKKKWDPFILEELGYANETNMPKEVVAKRTLVQTKNKEGMYTAPSFDRLENASQTLGGELLNDAFEILEWDRKNSEEYTTNELMKRKKYVTDVFGQITKMVQGKKALDIKANEMKVNEAGFVMDFMKAAASGEINAADLEDLKSVYTVKSTIDADVKE